MKLVPPIPKLLDHLGKPIDVYYVMELTNRQDGIINPQSGVAFSPKVTPDLHYLRFCYDN